MVIARQILSCVARVGQRFGATHVTSVLRGHASKQVVARGHERLSTFGLLGINARTGYFLSDASVARALRLVKGGANVRKLATDLYWWNDRTRADWCFDYHGATDAKPIPEETKA